MIVKVIDSILYAERELYVLDIDGKRTMVYKSSGLSGTGHGGEYIPFMYLCEGQGLDRIRYSPGYIYKEFYYDGKYLSHRKELDRYVGVVEFLDTLDNITKTHKPTEDLFYKVTDGVTQDKIHDIIWDLSLDINNRIRDNVEGYRPFDWATLGE